MVQSACGLDSVAEWLRRWIANPLLFERVSSNLTTVVFCKCLLSRSDKLDNFGNLRLCWVSRGSRDSGTHEKLCAVPLLLASTLSGRLAVDPWLLQSSPIIIRG